MVAAPSFTLAQAGIGQAHRVKALHAPTHAPEWSQWLEEIGFVSGEHVSVLAKGLPGADPLVVRIGQSTFALRRAEADCIELALPHELPELTSTPALGQQALA